MRRVAPDRSDAAQTSDCAPCDVASVPEMRVETLVIRGDVWQRVGYWNEAPTSHFTQRALLRDTRFSLHLTCGSESYAQLFSLLQGDEGLYSADGDDSILQMRGGGEPARTLRADLHALRRLSHHLPRGCSRTPTPTQRQACHVRRANLSRPGDQR